eukprot:7078873-Prymnesium_polylepis.1
MGTSTSADSSRFGAPVSGSRGGCFPRISTRPEVSMNCLYSWSPLHHSTFTLKLIVMLVGVILKGVPLLEREAAESATVPMHQAPTMYSPAPELPPGPNFPRRRPQRELGSSALRLE